MRIYLLMLLPVLIFGQDINDDVDQYLGENEWQEQLVNLTAGIINEVKEHPGFRARITQKALDYATTIAIDVLMSQLKYVEIPAIKERVGTTDVAISNVRIVRFDRPESRIVPMPGFGLSGKIWGLNALIEGDYEAEMSFGFFGSVQKSGTLSVKTQEMSFTIEILIGKDPTTERPTTISPNCFSGGDLIINFNGGWADMLNVGSSMFANTIRSSIASLICSTAQGEIDKNLNSELGTIPINETIAGLYDFNFGMTDYPTFNELYMETAHKGAAYYHGNRVEAPFEPAFIPKFENHTDKMAYVYVSDYVLNSGLYAGFLSGMLKYYITNEMLPDEIKQVLSSKCEFPAICLGTIFPGLPDKHPIGTVEINVYAEACPHVRFYDGHAAVLSAFGKADLFVKIDEDNIAPIFSMNFSVVLDFAVHINGTLVSFDVKSLTPKVKILSSNIGDVGTGFFYETIIRVASQSFILPKLAEFGRKGFEIPSMVQVAFSNPEIMKINEPGVFVVATDVNVSLPQDLNLIALLSKKNQSNENATAPENKTVYSGENEITTEEFMTYTTASTTVRSNRRKGRNRKNRNKNRNQDRDSEAAIDEIELATVESGRLRRETDSVTIGDFFSVTPTPSRKRKGGRGRSDRRGGRKNRKKNRNQTSESRAEN